MRAAARAAAPPGTPGSSRGGAKGQFSPQGVFNKRRPAGAGKQLLREEWRYQLQGPRQPQPRLDELVVVEGFNDMVAVARAVDAEVGASPPHPRPAAASISRIVKW